MRSPIVSVPIYVDRSIPSVSPLCLHLISSDLDQWHQLKRDCVAGLTPTWIRIADSAAPPWQLEREALQSLVVGSSPGPELIAVLRRIPDGVNWSRVSRLLQFLAHSDDWSMYSAGPITLNPADLTGLRVVQGSTTEEVLIEYRRLEPASWLTVYAPRVYPVLASLVSPEPPTGFQVTSWPPLVGTDPITHRTLTRVRPDMFA